MSNFFNSPMFPIIPDNIEYTKISEAYIKTGKINNSDLLIINPKAFTLYHKGPFLMFRTYQENLTYNN